MSVVTDYLDSLSGPDRVIIGHLNEIVRRNVAHVTEERYYAMPAFKYRGKGLVSILANKKFLSLYPYCAVESLGIDLSRFEHTSGSIHFSADDPISNELFQQILSARIKQIDTD